ncbi:hypothetical protein MRX96_057706 [Rhipicephalus microplus]
MLRVTKAKHRLFQESRQRDQLLRGRTAAGPCPLNAPQVPANWAALQNSNGEAQPALHMSFPSMNSPKRNHHKMKNNQSTPPTQGAENCHVYMAPNDELELHINDEDWDIVMGPLD